MVRYKNDWMMVEYDIIWYNMNSDTAKRIANSYLKNCITAQTNTVKIVMSEIENKEKNLKFKWD